MKYALFGLILLSASAFAEFSANVGYASKYYYRGVFQANNSVSVGADYESDANGLYVGTWIADVGEGAEVDIYAGYKFKDLPMSVGYTHYHYTDGFDSTYKELNLDISINTVLDLEYSVGRWKDQTYDFTGVTLEGSGTYGTAGAFGKDFAGVYLEVGHSKTFYNVDFGLAAIFSSKHLTSDIGVSRDKSLILTVGKVF